MTATDLTAKQARVLEYLIRYHREKDGWPTIRDIGAAFGIKSPNGVMSHLDALEAKGYIARSDKTSRSIRVLKGPDGKAVSGVSGLTREEIERAVNELFVNGCQETGTRLVLLKEQTAPLPTRDLGGYCPEAIVGRLCDRWGIV